MVISKKYIENGKISVEKGRVFFISDCFEKKELGKIGRVELSIECPENILGVYFIEHVMIFNEKDEQLHEDQEIVDNRQFNSREELLNALSEKYGISKDIIDEI